MMSTRPPSSLPAFPLVLIVFASGFAGLGYEMVWTRLFSVALGTDMMAVLGSIAGFFAGLAVGAFALDGWLRRTPAPRRAYALLELVIGGWGLLSIWALPAAGRCLPPLVGPDPAPTLLWAVSFALPVIVLLPATVAMGGTLTVLERLLAERRSSARLSAGVYAANTAGAVAGTLVSALGLFPVLGLSGTLVLLAAINGLCAAGVLVTVPAGDGALPGILPATPAPAAARPLQHEPPAAAGRGKAGPPPQGAASPALWRLGLLLLGSGLLGISAEVLVVRLAAQTLQNTLYSFAGLLAAYLAGTALGGALWQRHGGRVAAPMALPALLGGTALACLLTGLIVPLAARIATATAEAGIAAELGVALALFLLPAAAMGALFGHLIQAVRDQRGSLGWAIGINSLGAALAPLVAAQLLIPALGAWRALILTAAAYLLLLPWRRTALPWAAGPAVIATGLLLMPPPVLIRVPDDGAVLALREGPMATASAVSDPSGARYLEINGHFRMGGTSSMRSDYRQAFLPLLLHPAPQRALFLGIGTGATFVGGAQLPGVQVRAVELAQEVVDLLPWFAAPGQQAFPPVSVADARRYVAADVHQYDVIVADLFHPALEGSGALYTREHFDAVRHRLAPGGLFCQWLPLYQLDEPSLQSIIRTFLAVYPDGTAWLNHYSVRTPMLALIGHATGEAGAPGAALGVVRPAPADLGALTATLQRADVAAVTGPVGLRQPLDVLGQFVGGPRALASYAAAAPLNTDDRPFVALDARRNVQALSAPPADLLLRLLAAVHPASTDLTEGGNVPAAGTLAALPAYWRARDRFLQAGASLTGDPRGIALVQAAAPGLLEAVRLSADFEPAYQPLLGMAQALLAERRADGLALLEQIRAAAPGRTEAAALLQQAAPEAARTNAGAR